MKNIDYFDIGEKELFANYLYLHKAKKIFQQKISDDMKTEIIKFLIKIENSRVFKELKDELC